MIDRSDPNKNISRDELPSGTALGSNKVSRREFLVAGGAAVLAAALPRIVRATPARVKLRYWTFLDPAGHNKRSKAQSQMIADFEKKYPHVQIVPEVMAWQQIDPQLIQAAQAGNGPDVTRVLSSSISHMAQAGVIIPLDPWVNRWSAKEKADFFGSWDASLINHHKYSLPLEVAGTMFCFRNDLMQKAGLKKPATWQEYMQVAQALTHHPVYGSVVGFSRNNQASNLWQVLLPQAWSLGGDMFEGDRSIVDTPAWEETFAYWQKMVTQLGAAPRSVMTNTTDTVVEGYIAGKFVTMFNQTQKLAKVINAKTLPKNSMGVAVLPGMVPGRPAPNPLSGWHLGICKDCKHPEEAALFIDHMTGRDMQIVNSKVADAVPARASCGTDPYFKTPAARYSGAFLKVLETTGRTVNYPPRFNEMADGLAVAIQNVLVKNNSIRDELRKAASRYNAKQA